MRQSKVDKIWAAGFRVGLEPDSEHRCGHRWGGHILSAPASPVDGGVFGCREPRCLCTGTWDVTGPDEEERARVRQR